MSMKGVPWSLKVIAGPCCENHIPRTVGESRGSLSRRGFVPIPDRLLDSCVYEKSLHAASFRPHRHRAGTAARFSR